MSTLDRPPHGGFPTPNDYRRAPGDDVVIQVRVRRVNLPDLEAGVELGTDALTRSAIVLRLVPRDDGVHDLMVVTNAIRMAFASDAVDAVVIPGGEGR